MMGITAITIICTLVYLGVSLLCPTSTATQPRPREAHTPRPKQVPTLEEEFTEYFMELWLVREERWLRYALLRESPQTVSWNL